MSKNDSFNKENDPMKRLKLKAELNKLKIEYKKWEGDEEKREKLKKEMEAIRDEIRTKKINGIRDKKVTIYHHKDKEHVPDAMSGFFDAFIDLFGN